MSKQPSIRPVIILGAARSGTKFLRDTLAASRSVAATPYDLNFIWRTDNESCLSDALPADLFQAAIGRRISAALRRAAGIGPNDDRQLLEKTVSNTLRVAFVVQVFPDAKFVHIIRDGRDVVASSMTQWLKPVDFGYLAKKFRSFPLRNYRYALRYLGDRLLPRSASDTKAVWGVRYPGIDTDLSTLPLSIVCAKQWLASVSSVQQAEAEFGEHRIRAIRYEDLIKSETALVELVQWLDLRDSRKIVEQYNQTLRVGVGRSWRDAIPAENVNAVLTEIEPMLHSLGYI